MSTSVVLLAAGLSQRFGGKRPKQFLRVHNEPLFLKSLRVFVKHSSVHEIIVVTSSKMLGSTRRIVRKIKTKKLIQVVLGGSFRGESVKKGVRALTMKTSLVLVHDSARPMVSSDVIARVERASQKYGAALAAWPLPDTLKRATPQEKVSKTIPRKNLWLAQTPQGFKRAVALKCLLRPLRSATDDVELAERRGFKVKLVRGTPINIKVTYPHDLEICKAFLKK